MKVVHSLPPVGGIVPASVSMAGAVCAAHLRDPQFSWMEEGPGAKPSLVITNKCGIATVTCRVTTDSAMPTLKIATRWRGVDGTISEKDMDLSTLERVMPPLHRLLMSDPQFVEMQQSCGDYVRVEGGLPPLFDLKEAMRRGNCMVRFPYSAASGTTTTEDLYLVSTKPYFERVVASEMAFSLLYREAEVRLVFTRSVPPESGSSHDMIKRGLIMLIGVEARHTLESYSDCRGYVTRHDLTNNVSLARLSGAPIYNGFNVVRLSAQTRMVQGAFAALGINLGLPNPPSFLNVL